MREAKRVIAECGVDIVEIMKKRKLSFVNHIARFGLTGKEQHLVKLVLLWRSLAWWHEQQRYNETIADHEKFLHTTAFGRPRRYETQFGRNWMLKAIKTEEPEA